LINSGVMCDAEQKSADVPDAGEAIWFSCKAHRSLLNGIAAVRLVSGEIEEESV
jgi:hypothetical protein